ncbi:MAG TPA: Wzz/FepE/Etk N-terminal domain-containing protein [Jatrophihabitantaceae bacterium]|jgi:hypothetical protein|nr:Wzz/FepE/Etk N-terminal domain-containing protein [Jatrophihabitantaceae bacterium]
MEIGTYLRGLLRRWWLVVLIALIAASGAFVIDGGATDSYTASDNLTVPQSLATTAGANGQYVANFSVGLTTPEVLDTVAKAAGVSTSTISSRLSASQVGSSSFIQVSYVGKNRDRAQIAVVSATKATAALLAKGAIETANTEVSAAQTALTNATAQQDAAQKALDAYTAANGYVDPNVLFQAAQSSITQLNVSKQQAIASGHATGNFDVAIQNAEAQLQLLAPKVSAYNKLNHALNDAQAQVSSARARQSTAAQDLAIASAPPLVDQPVVTVQTGRSTLLKGVAIAGGIGVVLGLALILLIEYIIASRRQRAAAAEAA